MSNIENFEQTATLLLHFMKKDIYTEEDIEVAANDARKIVPLTDEMYMQAIRNIHSRFSITMDKGVALKDKSHVSWYPMRKSEIEPYYWKRYKSHLQLHHSWPANIIKSIDDSTDEIMDLLGDPQKTSQFRRSGLIIGDVQSGKTAMYTALCNKAADAKYQVIILLTGTMENLRRQTQERIDSGFVGRKSKEALNRNIQTLNIGVGLIDSTRVAMTFTSEIRDFSAQFLENLGLRLKDNKEPVIFVVKKNKRILDNLSNWLKLYNADHNNAQVDLPLLLIDDEADNASVNTRGEDDPTAINKAIRSLLALFTKATYVGVTATPYANIFIDPDADLEMLGDDLFPSNFIYSLETPTNYIGSTSIFGDKSAYSSNLTIIEDIDDIIDEYLRFHQKRTVDLRLSNLPESLREAICYFVLTNVIRDSRGQGNQHRSMLINASRLTVVHGEIGDQVEDYIRDLQADIDNYSKLDIDKVSGAKFLNELRNVWNSYDFGELSGLAWDHVQNNCLAQAVKPIEVKVINSISSTKKIDYGDYKNTGARIIAVGGNSLSRGLTLEGLCVSYFYRSAKMYDTLLQMGRWFGYRTNYDDLFRIFMTQEAIDWFQYITEATVELKSEVTRMNEYGLTPNDFGLRVRQDINSLIVTARNKMRHTNKIVRNITIAGKLIETPRLSASLSILGKNEAVALSLFERLEQHGAEISHFRTEKLYKDVDPNIIINFLSNYDVHPDNLAFNRDAMISYIRKSQHFKKWDVAIPQGHGEMCPNFKVKKQERAFKKRDDMLMISGTKLRVGTGGCTKAGLEKSQIDNINRSYRINNSNKAPKDDEFLIAGRNPILLIHILKANSNSSSDVRTDAPIVAVGVGFPKTENGSSGGTVQYVINLVAVRKGMIETEYEGDDYYDFE